MDKLDERERQLSTPIEEKRAAILEQYPICFRASTLSEAKKAAQQAGYDPEGWQKAFDWSHRGGDCAIYYAEEARKG